MEDAELFMTVAVADRQGKSIREVMEYPASEFVLWAAYLKLVKAIPDN